MSGMTQEEKNEILVNAVKKKNVKATKEILALGADPDTYGESDIPVLTYICRFSDKYNFTVTTEIIEIVECLLKAGASVNINNEFNDTPLISAILQNYTEIIKMLLEYGADVNIATLRESKNTPLIYAIFSGNTDIVTMLIKAGADVNVVNQYGNTALIYSATKGRIDMMGILMKAGASINIKNNKSKSALDILKDEYPEKYKEWMGWEFRKKILGHEDTTCVNCPYCEPDFDI